MLAHPDAEVTLLYGNRATGTVMFAKELADLKNTHGARLDLVHVLSREPRDVELFSGRLDATRLRRLLTVLVPVDSSTTSGCAARSGSSPTRAMCWRSSESLANRVHFELFYVDEPPPEVRRAEAVGPRGDELGDHRPRRADHHCRDAQELRILDGAPPPVTTCPSPAKGVSAAHAGPWSPSGKSTCGATTPSTTTRWTAGTC